MISVVEQWGLAHRMQDLWECIEGTTENTKQITVIMWHQLGDDREKGFCCEDLQIEYLLGHNGKPTTMSIVWKCINVSKLWEVTVVNDFCWIKTGCLVLLLELSLAVSVFKCEWNTPECNSEVFEVGYF